MDNKISFIEMSKPLSKSFMFKLILIDVITSCIELALRFVDFIALCNTLIVSQSPVSLSDLLIVLKDVFLNITDTLQLLTVAISAVSIFFILTMRDRIPYFEENRASILKKYHRFGNPEVIDLRAYMFSEDFTTYNLLVFLVWNQIYKLNKFNQTVIGNVPLIEVIGSNFKQYLTLSIIQLAVALIFCII